MGLSVALEPGLAPLATVSPGKGLGCSKPLWTLAGHGNVGLSAGSWDIRVGVAGA